MMFIFFSDHCTVTDPVLQPVWLGHSAQPLENRHVLVSNMDLSYDPVTIEVYVTIYLYTIQENKLRLKFCLKSP